MDNSFIVKPQSAIIVGIVLKSEEQESSIENDLDELESLLNTLNIITKKRVIQKRDKLVSRSLIGIGKIDEIKTLIDEFDVSLIVFNRELTGVQTRNIEKHINCRVVDRTGIILDIFAKHARTNYAKTQVEIARLEYILPRLSGAWTHFHRQTGGSVKARGMGKKKIEIDRRRTRDRIAKLQRQLEQIDIERKERRKGRSNELKVSLVGYTNTGKTTLMNSLTKAELLAKDELFATLDTNIKIIDPKTRPKILLSDTVGFIKNLPHKLIESFKSTLDEVLEADLLLHVIDISHNQYTDQINVTDKVLEDIGAGEIPQIKVFNKTDKLNDPFLPRVLKNVYKDSIFVSAHLKEDAHKLREYIYRFFESNMIHAELKVPHNDKEALSLIHNTCLIISSDYENNENIIFNVLTTKSVFPKLKKYAFSYKDQNDEQKNIS